MFQSLGSVLLITPEGNLVIHQSSTNTVGLVTVADNDS